MPVRHKIDCTFHVNIVFQDIGPLFTAVVQDVAVGNGKIPFINMKLYISNPALIHCILQDINLILHICAVD